MDELERKLAWGLRPVQPPSGFADGVMASVAGRRRGRARRARAWLAAAALLAGALSGTAVVERQHHRRAQEEMARRQFDLAMQVTGKTISQVEERISRIGVKSSEVEQ